VHLGEHTAVPGRALEAARFTGGAVAAKVLTAKERGAHMAGELQIEELKEGAGAEAVSGTTVTVHYVGTLTDGKKFDSSRDRGSGFTFRLGAGQVIKGWDQGVAGMKIGQVRKLTIPPHLAYGDRGFPPVIPPGSTLVFEVELLGVK
jgi:FKBP-type peptidyl-prolyl cis-trans isomerase